METLTDIISVVSDCTGVPRWDVLIGKDKESLTAKKKVCFIIANAYPHLLTAFSSTANVDRKNIFALSDEVEAEIKTDADMRHIMNVIRVRLGLPSFKKDKRRRKKKISHTKQLFGFDYTEKEAEQRRNAIVSANIFMRKYCTHGRQPIDPGMVFTKEMRARVPYKSWYHK